MADEKISALSDGGGLQVGDEFVVARGAGNNRITRVGASELIYRYTISGTDKASIDTGVDARAAGSNDWTNGDLLEVYVLARTDKAVVSDSLSINLNNDTGANYDLAVVSSGGGGTPGGGTAVGQTSWHNIDVHGANGSASYASLLRLIIPDYAGTTFWKSGDASGPVPDATAANNEIRLYTLGYRSTSAITRLAVAAQGTQKLKVGSQLLIYKRIAG